MEWKLDRPFWRTDWGGYVFEGNSYLIGNSRLSSLIATGVAQLNTRSIKEVGA
jgi:hypothetical protein